MTASVRHHSTCSELRVHSFEPKHKAGKESEVSEGLYPQRPPPKTYFLHMSYLINSATNWGPNVQILEPVGDIMPPYACVL